MVYFLALITATVAVFVFFKWERSGSTIDDGERMVLIPSGEYITNSKNDSLQLAPIDVAVDSFYMDRHPVTVEQFREFINETNYETSAEAFGNAAVFDYELRRWVLLEGATWRYPLGPDGPKAKDDHPVTQVSWFDAMAYCEWAGFRLPTEFEWEYAARNAGKIVNAIYPWNSNDVMENGTFKANFWQGVFPLYNNVKDGYRNTSPVGAFGATPLGLQDMAGNVWEWSVDWKEGPGLGVEKLQHGGSFLCDTKVCHGFRLTASSSSTPESSLMNVGFRCVKDLAKK